VINLASPRAFNRRHGVDAMTWMQTLVAPRRGQKVDFYISHPEFPASYADLHCVKHRRAAAVQNYLNGGTWELVGGFTEVESGAQERAARAGEGVGRWGDSDKMTQIVCIGPATGNDRRASPRREKS
jgi:hypothetical protein